MDQQDITTLEEKAIKQALNCQWEEAINTNQLILKTDEKNLASLNRLGVAYLKTNQIKLAKTTFQKALKLSSHNLIARKNIDRIKHLSTNHKNKRLSSICLSKNPNLVSFVEEPGISKIVPLIKPDSHQLIADLEIGQLVFMKSSARKIKIITADNQYIGQLPDNLSLKLAKFIKAGYKYQVSIKSINPQSPSIFIQEIKRSKRLKEVPTFSSQNNNFKINLRPQKLSVPPLQIFDPLEQQEE